MRWRDAGGWERRDEMESGGERGEALEGDEKEGSKIKH